MDIDSADVETLEQWAKEAEWRGALPEARNLWQAAMGHRRTGQSPELFVRTAARLADVLITLGEYDAAEEVLDEARQHFVKGLAQKNEGFLQYLESESLLEQVRGNWFGAFNSLNLAAVVAKLLYGTQHPTTVKKLTARARVEINAGMLDMAEQTLAEAMASLRSLPAGAISRLAPECQHLQAVIHLNRQEYEAAMPLLEDCWRALCQQTQDGLTLAPVQRALAAAYTGTGRLPEAITALEEVLRLQGPAREARWLLTLFPLEQLALVNAALNRWEIAMEIAREAERVWQQHADRAFSVATDELRGLFADTMRGHSAPGFALFLARALHDGAGARECLEMVWQRKGIATGWLALQQQALYEQNDGEAFRLFEEWRGVRAAIALRWRAQKQEPPQEGGRAYQQELYQLGHTADGLEKQIAAKLRIAGNTQPRATVQEIAEALPAGSVLVEYIRGFRLDPQAFRRQFEGGETYFAFVLPSGNAAGIRCFDLGNANEIEDLIAVLDERILPSYQPKTVGHTLANLLQALELRLWEPLASAVAGAKHAIIAPDGEIARVPFAALRNAKGEYLLARHVLSFVNSGSEALRHARQTTVGLNVVMANPNFGQSPQFKPLPYSHKEGVCVAEALGRDTQLFEGASASKARLLALRAPRTLHLATHGLVLPDTASPEDDYFELGFPQRDSSLLRSGIAFSDGVATAFEIAGMNLHLTELVVLSACQSGLGTVRTGESIYGLRRSFFIAGARRLVTSLWSISDRHTAELMELFYQALQAGKAPADALREASLLLSRIAPHPVYWAGFALFGDPDSF